MTYDSTIIQVRLKSALGPGADGSVEGLLGLKGSAVSSLGVLVASTGSCGTKSIASLSRNVVAKQFSAVLADQGTQLVDLGTLGN